MNYDGGKDLFNTMLVSTAQELVVTPYRFGCSKNKAQESFGLECAKSRYPIAKIALIGLISLFKLIHVMKNLDRSRSYLSQYKKGTPLHSRYRN